MKSSRSKRRQLAVENLAGIRIGRHLHCQADRELREVLLRQREVGINRIERLERVEEEGGCLNHLKNFAI